MSKWQQIDTPSGHILVCLFLILLGAAFHVGKIPKSEDLIIGGSGAVMMAMRAANSNTKGGGNPPASA